MSARDILSNLIDEYMLDSQGNHEGIADAILADKRIAVVELPESQPNSNPGEPPEEWDYEWRSEGHSVYVTGANIEVYGFDEDGDVARVDLITLEARDLAAALLAAANAAEATR